MHIVALKTVAIGVADRETAYGDIVVIDADTVPAARGCLDGHGTGDLCTKCHVCGCRTTGVDIDRFLVGTGTNDDFVSGLQARVECLLDRTIWFCRTTVAIVTAACRNVINCH